MTQIDTGRRPQPNSRDRAVWERRWLRLAGLEARIVDSAVKRLATSNGLPGGTTRTELVSTAEEAWEFVRHEACGAIGTGTMATRLDELERDFTGADLEAQTVAYVAASVANRVRNVWKSPAARNVSYDEIPQELRAGGPSVADEAIGRVRYREALQFISEEVSPAARAVAGARASSITSRDEQVLLTGLREGTIKEASKELTRARVLLAQRLGTVVGPIAAVGAGFRRWVTPERAEAAVAVGSAGMGIKLAAGAALSVAIAVTAIAVPLKHAVEDQHPGSPAKRVTPHVGVAVTRATAIAQTRGQVVRSIAVVAATKTHTSGARSATSKAVKKTPKVTAAAREFSVSPTKRTASTAVASTATQGSTAAAKQFAPPPAKAPVKSAAATEFR